MSYLERKVSLNEEDEALKQSRQIIEEYEINPFTMLVIPVNYGSRVYSKIYELEEECLSPFKPFDIIKEGCEFFGVPYEGRKNGTKKLIGATRKIPIAISPTNSIYFFPTTSPDRLQCMWVALEHIVDFKRVGKNTTLVTFKNNQKFEIPISFGSFQNQFSQTIKLKSKLNQRIENTNQKLAYINKKRNYEASERIGHYDL
jgi:competence protein ComK